MFVKLRKVSTISVLSSCDLSYFRLTYSWFVLNSWWELEVKIHFVWRFIKAKWYAIIIFNSCYFILERHFIRCSFKIFPESLFFREIQGTLINEATFPSKLSPCAAIHFYQRLQRCWKYSWNLFCESPFTPSVQLLTISAASQKDPSFSADFIGGNR